MTEVFHALSVTFPAGETFFMDSVQHYESELREHHPALWQDVLLFLKQEALHSAQHEKWNRRIQAWTLLLLCTMVHYTCRMRALLSAEIAHESAVW